MQSHIDTDCLHLSRTSLIISASKHLHKEQVANTLLQRAKKKSNKNCYKQFTILCQASDASLCDARRRRAFLSSALPMKENMLHPGHCFQNLFTHNIPVHFACLLRSFHSGAARQQRDSIFGSHALPARISLQVSFEHNLTKASSAPRRAYIAPVFTQPGPH